MECMLKEREFVYAYEQKIQRHVEILDKINVNFGKEHAIGIVFKSLKSSYDQFILTYHLNNTETTLVELHNMLQTAKAGMKKSHSNSYASSLVMAIK